MAGLAQKLVDAFGHDHVREYDAIGRLRSCRQGTRLATFSYDALGRPGGIRVEDTQAAVVLATTLSYDDFSREIRRVITGGAEQVIETSYLANGQVARRVTTTGGQLWRDERYHYDALGRLDEYTCAGSQPPVDATGRPVTAQRFAFDKWSNVTRLDTTYPDRQDTALFRYSATDPTQLIELERGGKTITLAYDAAGNLTRDERGRELQYDSQQRLVKVLEGGQVLSEYHYDALGKLVRQTMRDGEAQRRYQGEIVSNQTVGDRVITYLGVEGSYFAQGEQGMGARSRLLATNDAHSPVMSVDVATSGGEDFTYTPYGERSSSGAGDCLIGFNGESLDPVTGWYFLGNGYRVYNPALLRFHSPDCWSPFGQGGLNPYLYGGSDPINWSDPTGHLSAGAWVSIGIGIAGILFGIVTLGAGAAISAGMIAGSGFIGAIAATSALSVTAATVGLLSSAVGIASAALEDNQQASSILGWVSMGLGVVSATAGVAAIARSAVSAASGAYASATAAKIVKNEIAGITESLLAQSLAVARSEVIGIGVSAISQSLGVASLGTGIAGAIASENGNSQASNVLNWVSRGLGIASLAANAGFAGQGSGGGGGAGSGSNQSGSGSTSTSPRASAGKSSSKPPPSAEASGSSVALLSVRPLGDQSVFRVSSDRINNAYQPLPITAGTVYRRAELEVQSTFLTRL
jgi:RHS repeat-associated protein